LDTSDWVALTIISVFILISIPLYFSFSKSFREIIFYGQQPTNPKNDSKSKGKLLNWLEDAKWSTRIFGIFAAVIIALFCLGIIVMIVLTITGTIK
jgi:hypothetical protein